MDGQLSMESNFSNAAVKVIAHFEKSFPVLRS